MKVNGNQIREQLKLWRKEKDFRTLQLDNCKYAFPEEKKATVKEAASSLFDAENGILWTEALQQKYNLAVTAHVKKGSDPSVMADLPLAVVIKLEGMIHRFESIWNALAKEALGGTVMERRLSYGPPEPVMPSRPLEQDKVYAEPQFGLEECRANEKRYTAASASIKAGIALANTKEITLGEGEFKEFGADLFEV